MIPRNQVDFLARASVAVASTRDGRLTPHLHWLSGWQVEEDQETVLCLVAELFTGSLIESLQSNGQFAMVAERIGPHECYQYKGRFVDSRPPKPADEALFVACRERFVAAVSAHLVGRSSVERLRLRSREPTVAVRFRVEEIYLQTPGPGAGARLHPPENG